MSGTDAVAPPGIVCPNCGDTDCKPGDRFCEGCGKPLTPPATSDMACVCGWLNFDEDGFCTRCGAHRKTRRDQLDSQEIGPGLAAVTDVGIRHKRNDDAFSISGPANGGPGTVIAVLDGVSNSQVPDVASASAARAARERVETSLAAGDAPATAIRNGIVAAHDAVCMVPFDRQADLDPPAATIVLAHIAPGNSAGTVLVTFGWLGDSRIFWLASKGGGKQLTKDHSWANEVVGSGQMTEAEARVDPRYHAIVKCLGTTDFSRPTPCPDPSVETIELPAEGWLLACTDGLWNYAETPLAITSEANGQLRTGTAMDACRRLIAFALTKGGMDNITVALARLG